MMTTYDIKRLALISAINAEVEAMRAANMERRSYGASLIYNERDFYHMADKLKEIAFGIRQSKNKRRK